jgi:hypothetical protein
MIGSLGGGAATAPPARKSNYARALSLSGVEAISVPNGGSARAYLADSSRRQRSSHHGHPRHDSERARILMQTVVFPERAHMPLMVCVCGGPRNERY